MATIRASCVGCELAEHHEGPPISHDDLLDFHALLQTDGWLDSLVRSTPI